MFVIGELLMFVIDWICVASSNGISEPHLLTTVALASTASAAKTRTVSFNILVKVFLKSNLVKVLWIRSDPTLVLD